MNLHQRKSLINTSCPKSRIKPLALALPLIAAPLLVPVQSALAEGINTIEEVIVSARKRDESLQEVPVVVNVISEGDINSQRIESITDIGTVVPGMVASTALSGTSGFIYIRGVGTGSGNPAFDQAVAINVDGMGVNSAQMMNAGMFDLKQIEVLKGPQALFFGKNSPGGVIAIHTNDPGDEFELELTGMYETVGEEKSLRGIVSGPLSDTFGARLAFGQSDANDSWRNFVNQDRFETGPDGPVQTAFKSGDPEYNNSFLMATLLWEPTENFSAKLKLARLEDDQKTPSELQTTYCPYGAAQGIVYPIPGGDKCRADDELTSGDVNPEIFGALKNGRYAGKTEGFVENENDLAVLELDYDVTDTLNLTSVTGYFDNENDRIAESSAQNVSGLALGSASNLEQWSQELRLTSNFEGNVNFMLGAFYEDKEVGQDLDVIGAANLYAPAAIPALGNFPIFFGRQISVQDSTAYSVFGQLDWEFSEQWTLAVGGRYSYEEKENSIVVNVVGSVPDTDIPLLEPKADWSNFSPEATLSYQYTDNIMFFASYREGFKSGGYNNSYGVGPKVAVALSGGSLDIVYNEENVDGFEVGMKSTLLDDTLRFNVTAYSFDYEDLQLSKFDGASISFTLFNAGKASIYGLEAETFWVTPVDGLTLTANVAWGKAEFDEFLSPCYAGQTIALGCDTEFNSTTGAFVGIDMSGESLPFASDLSANLGASYATAVSDNWNVTLNMTASFKDDYNPSSQRIPDQVQQDSYWWINAGVSLSSSDDKWEVFFRGVNLTDETYLLGGVAAPFGGTGNNATTGTDDATGLPDFVSFVQGGQQFNIGVTYRM